MAKDAFEDRFRLSLLALAGWAAIAWFGMPILSSFGSAAVDVLGISVSQITLLHVVFVIAVSALFSAEALGLAPPRPKRSVAALWLPLVYIVGALAVVWLEGAPDGAVMQILFVGAALGAIAQEVMFGGILFAGLRTRFSALATVWITGLVSGVAWLPFWLWRGLWAEGIADAISGIFFAVVLGAVRIRSGSLYLCIALSAVWEFVYSLLRATLGTEVWTSVPFQSVSILLPLYGVFLLRRRSAPPNASAPAEES